MSQEALQHARQSVEHAIIELQQAVGFYALAARTAEVSELQQTGISLIGAVGAAHARMRTGIQDAANKRLRPEHPAGDTQLTEPEQQIREIALSKAQTVTPPEYPDEATATRAAIFQDSL